MGTSFFANESFVRAYNHSLEYVPYAGAPKVKRKKEDSQRYSKGYQHQHQHHHPAAFLDDPASTEDDEAIAYALQYGDDSIGKMLHRASKRAHVPRGTARTLDKHEIEQHAKVDGYNRLQDRLRAYGLMEKQMIGDGSCQFRAVSDQLFGNAEYHHSIRTDAVNQIKKNKEHYKTFVEGNFDDYCHKMSKGGEWGDALTLQAIADGYKIRINLLTSFEDSVCTIVMPSTTPSPERYIWLSFWAELHYNSLYRSDGASTVALRASMLTNPITTTPASTTAPSSSAPSTAQLPNTTSQNAMYTPSAASPSNPWIDPATDTSAAIITNTTSTAPQQPTTTAPTPSKKKKGKKKKCTVM